MQASSAVPQAGCSIARQGLAAPPFQCRGAENNLVWHAQEIVDETDQYVDNERHQRVNAAMLMRNLPPNLQHALKLHAGIQRSRSGQFGGALPGHASPSAAAAASASPARGKPKPKGLPRLPPVMQGSNDRCSGDAGSDAANIRQPLLQSHEHC